MRPRGVRGWAGLIGLGVLVAQGGGCGGGELEAPRPPPVSTAPCADPPFVGAPFGLRCGQLVDEGGRVAFVRGVNARVRGIFDVTFDDGRLPLEEIPEFSAADLDALRGFGFDALRLPIQWSAIEPTEDGGLSEPYLTRIADLLQAAQGAGVQVLLDFHQDAYSKEIGEDGAPRWAISPQPKTLLGGPLTDLDARRQSPEVLAAFDTFFGASEEGARLRGRFADMAGKVAARFAGHPAVIGIELFNEPLAPMDGLMRVHEAAYATVRAAAPKKLIAFEPSATRNFFDDAPLPPHPLGDGTLYAPHTYKLAFSTGVGDVEKARAAMTKDTLRPQVINAREEADAWRAGLFVTEYGYDPKGTRAAEYLTWQAELHEEVMASSFFWLWKESSQGSWGCYEFDAATGTFTPREALRLVLARVRATRVSGWPAETRFERATGVFSLRFRDDPTMVGDSVIAVAPALGAPLGVTCDGVLVDAALDARGELRVPCGKGTGEEHVLGVTVAPRP